MNDFAEEQAGAAARSTKMVLVVRLKEGSLDAWRHIVLKVRGACQNDACGRQRWMNAGYQHALSCCGSLNPTKVSSLIGSMAAIGRVATLG